MTNLVRRMQINRRRGPSAPHSGCRGWGAAKEAHSGDAFSEVDLLPVERTRRRLPAALRRQGGTHPPTARTGVLPLGRAGRRGRIHKA